MPKSLYSDDLALNYKNQIISQNDIKLQKKHFFSEMIKYIKLKDINNVYKYANLIMNQPDFKEEDFLSKNKMTPFHYLFSSFRLIKTSNNRNQNKNLSNITEKDSMIINENNKICSSRGNKLSLTSSKAHFSIDKYDENNIIAKSKIIGNFLFQILSPKIINTRSLDRWGAIHIAIRRGGYRCLEWIINKNKIMKEANFNKLVSSHNNLDIGNSIKKVQTLTQKKTFNLNLKGKEDWTPLHLSAKLELIDKDNLI